MNSMQVQCFLTAARRLNFTESAAELFISQPAFSHNISALEKEWGIELFIRDKKFKNTQLTRAGNMMYAGMTDLQNQFEYLLHKAQNIHEGKSGTLRIGFISSNRMNEKALKLINDFQKKYPDVNLSLQSGSHSELVQWLHNHTLDLAFVLKIDVENKHWIVVKKLYNVDSVLILSKEHPLANKKNLSLKDFQNDTFVNVSPSESRAINALLKQECENAGFTPKFLEVPDINTQVLYLESGKVIAIGNKNNMAALNDRMTTCRLRDLKPMEMVVANNRASDNPCIDLFCSSL